MEENYALCCKWRDERVVEKAFGLNFSSSIEGGFRSVCAEVGRLMRSSHALGLQSRCAQSQTKGSYAIHLTGRTPRHFTIRILFRHVFFTEYTEWNAISRGECDNLAPVTEPMRRYLFSLTGF